MSAALVARDLAYAYPDGRRGLDDVSLEVATGERVAVLGPNGAGKTTFALHCNGILTPSAGTIEVDGLPVAGEHLREVRRRVGLVFQDPDDQLFASTVRDDVAFGPANLGRTGTELDQVVDDALARFGLTALADRPPYHLSMGEKRRAALAGVMAMAPTVLVLDEPTANLDPWTRQELGLVLDGLEVTQVIVTHDLLFALERCPRAVILDRGRVVADGATEDLLADPELLAAHRLVLPKGLGR